MALLLSSCGPTPQGFYHGEVIDHAGQAHACTLEIIPTAPGRVHIHLDYDDQCDGDGALVFGDILLPDAGGEILLDTYTLHGNFFSAAGHEYTVEVRLEGAK